MAILIVCVICMVAACPLRLEAWVGDD